MPWLSPPRNAEKKIAPLISGAEICSAEKALICKALWLHFGNHPTAAILTSQFVRVHVTMWTANNTYTVFMYRIIYYYIHYSVFSSCIPCITSTFPAFLAHRNPRFKAAAQLRFFVWPKFKIWRVHDLPSQSPSEFQAGL